MKPEWFGNEAGMVWEWGWNDLGMRLEIDCPCQWGYVLHTCLSGFPKSFLRREELLRSRLLSSSEKQEVAPASSFSRSQDIGNVRTVCVPATWKKSRQYWWGAHTVFFKTIIKVRESDKFHSQSAVFEAFCSDSTKLSSLMTIYINYSVGGRGCTCVCVGGRWCEHVMWHCNALSGRRGVSNLVLSVASPPFLRKGL